MSEKIDYGTLPAGGFNHSYPVFPGWTTGHTKRLSKDQVKKIKRKLRDNGYSVDLRNKLAEQFDVDVTTISDIAYGKTHKGVKI